MTANTNAAFSWWQLVCFGILTTPIAMSGLALVAFIPTFYAVDVGLGLTAVGIVFACGRIFDVVTDPLIGHYSDQTRSRFGFRKPWMVLGLPLFCLSVWLLLVPPDGAGIIYLIAASSLFFLFYTVVDVPYTSIGLEVSSNVNERTLLASSKSVFQVLGAIFVSLIPFVFALPVPDYLRVIAQCVMALSVVAIILFLFFVPQSDRIVTAPRVGFLEGCKWVLSNHVYRYLIGAFFIVQSANALSAGLTVLYVTHVIKAPQLVGAGFLVLFISTAIFLPLWVLISRKWDKKFTWSVSIVVCSIGLLCSLLMGEGDIIAFLILCAVLGAAFGCDAIMPTSILADIVSEGEKGGKNRFAATYLAFKNAVSKLTFVVPLAIAFPILDYVGFDKAGANGETQLLTLTLFFAGVPVLLRVLALVIVNKAPITAAELKVKNAR